MLLRAKCSFEDADLYLGLYCLAWFLFARPSEVCHLTREKLPSGYVKFAIPFSKVDQHGRGFSVVFRCSCIAAGGIFDSCRIKFCPIHCLSAAQFKKIKSASAYLLRSRFMAFLSAAEISNPTMEDGRSKFNLYSLRIGGVQSAVVSGLPRLTVLRLGRWQSSQTQLRYEASAALTNEEGKALSWPLVEVDVV